MSDTIDTIHTKVSKLLDECSCTDNVATQQVEPFVKQFGWNLNIGQVEWDICGGLVDDFLRDFQVVRNVSMTEIINYIYSLDETIIEFFEDTSPETYEQIKRVCVKFFKTGLFENIELQQRTGYLWKLCTARMCEESQVFTHENYLFAAVMLSSKKLQKEFERILYFSTYYTFEELYKRFVNAIEHMDEVYTSQMSVVS